MRDTKEGFSKWDGVYDKVPYLVIAETGAHVPCWPNAGKMNAMDSSGRSWKPEDDILIKKITWDIVFAMLQPPEK